MNRRQRGPGGAGGAALERAVVLLLLEDRTRRWAAGELAAELEIDAVRLHASVEALQQQGVVCRAAGRVWPSAAACRLDELGLISV